MENICYKIKLEQKKSNHSNIRTRVIEGYCHDLPEKNVPFIMFSEGLEGGMRIIKTTPLAKVSVSDKLFYDFETMNSVYNLEVLKTCDRSELEQFLTNLTLNPNFIN